MVMVDLPSKVRRERKPPPSMDQRKVQLDALGRAIDTICASWEDALSAVQARGFAAQSPGPKAAAGIIRPDPKDPLHAREMPGASGASGAYGNPTRDAAFRYLDVDTVKHRFVGGDPAERWITDATRFLSVLLAMSSADERIDPSDGYLGHARPRWSGPFWPPHLRLNFRRAADDVVTLWPKNCALLFERIHALANVARSEWPATLRPGTSVIDRDSGKEIVVGGGRRADTGAVCAMCDLYASGDASDPVGRIDGKPYHRKPGMGHGACYFTKQRRG